MKLRLVPEIYYDSLKKTGYDIDTCAEMPAYQQVVDWFRVRHNLVLDVFQEFDEENKCYTDRWEVDISKLGIYEDPHTIVVNEKYVHYYDAWDRAIRDALLFLIQKHNMNTPTDEPVTIKDWLERNYDSIPNNSVPNALHWCYKDLTGPQLTYMHEITYEVFIQPLRPNQRERAWNKFLEHLKNLK